jgi:hypothetical protein
VETLTQTLIYTDLEVIYLVRSLKNTGLIWLKQIQTQKLGYTYYSTDQKSNLYHILLRVDQEEVKIIKSINMNIEENPINMSDHHPKSKN